MIDVAMGTCAGVPAQPVASQNLGLPPITFGPPVIIQIAIELKSIWTEHGKARLNRLRDFNSFHGYAHQYNERTISAAFLVVNSSNRFWSPLRDQENITTHGTVSKNSRQFVKETVDKFRSIHLRNSINDGPGLEALGVVVIEHDNLEKNPLFERLKDLHMPTRIAPIPPSLSIGDPLHYETMIQRICNAFRERYS